ncbi:MAG: phosphate signaling complex protein PhoU [Spirochaetales bacterium]|nr:phosphate signaling complex protein PhoU [Spirochaetales bacterium]
MDRKEHMTLVYQQVLRMGTYVEEALGKALHAMLNQNLLIAQEIILNDRYIDESRLAIEDSCTKIIATKQPVSSQLRELITLMQVSSDLERIGDHARHMAKVISTVREPLLERVIPDFERMARIGIRMVNRSLHALVNQDSEEARAIAAEDRKLNELHRELSVLIIGIMKESPTYIEDGTQLMLVNRFLERLGDHVTHICEGIVYAKQGAHVSLHLGTSENRYAR